MSDRRNTLRPGDIVSRPKGVVRHVGVVVEDGVLHNVPGRGEHVSSLESFAAGPFCLRRGLQFNYGVQHYGHSHIVVLANFFRAAFERLIVEPMGEGE